MKLQYILFITFCFSNLIFSQKGVILSSEKYIEYQEKSRANINNSIDSSFYYANKIETSTNYIHQAFAKGIKSYLFQIKNDTINSNKNYQLSIDILKNEKNSREKTKTSALLYNYKGLTDWQRKKFSNALNNYFKAKELANSIDEKALVITINNNIALIYGEIGEYDKAITISKQSDAFLDKNVLLYDDEKFKLNKSLIYLNIGNYFTKKYKENKNQKSHLDSSEVYFQKCIVYSKDIIRNRFIAQRNLASVYQMMGKSKKAESLIISALYISKSKNYKNDYFDLIYNLADLYYYDKDYLKAIIYFKKVDSIFLKTNYNPKNFINSNYFQAKIYDSLKNNEKAYYYSKIYLDNFEKNEFKESNEIVKVNSLLSSQYVKDEVLKIKSKTQYNLIYKYLFILLFFIIFLYLLYVLKQKINSEKKTKLLLEKYKANNLKLKENIILEDSSETPIISNLNKLTSNTVTISKEKELEILEKIKELEIKKYFLKPEFSQTLVAKKLKTNTTYISFVVNKYYNKTFSEYANELKINYVINEIISNVTYRKYSTQAIAESVGYKNNVSFTKTFNKKTGLTPAQFIKNIEGKI